MVIYQVTNMINGMIYIGKTERNIEKRIHEHVYDAVSRDSKTYFHRAIKKYGAENFEWDVLLDLNNEHIKNYSSLYIESSNGEYYKIPDKDLGKIERAFISMYKKFGYALYNLTDGGEGMSGWVPSEETRLKIGKANKGRIPGEETRRKISEAGKGNKYSQGCVHSEETKKKRIESFKKSITEETRQKWRDALVKNLHSEEAKLKRVENLKGRPGMKAEKNPMYGKHHSEETKQKIREKAQKRTGEKNHRFGKQCSEETKKKISESMKARCEHKRLLKMGFPHNDL